MMNRLLDLIDKLKTGSCWCAIGIGDPMLKEHSDVCKEVREVMTACEEIEKRAIERALFIILHHFRIEILASPALDGEDKTILSKFYDDRRGRGW